MITKKASLNSMNLIGHEGEKNAVRVCFDLLPFIEHFPGGRVKLLVQRSGDADAYPVDLEVDGSSAYWTVTETDTAVFGYGKCELQWYLNDILVKSEIFTFLVRKSLAAGETPEASGGKVWFEKIESEIGNLDELSTKTKESLVAAINEVAEGCTEDNALEALAESGIVTPAYQNGAFYTSDSGEIYVI